MSALKICPQCATEYPANARFCEIDGTALRAASGATDMVGSIVAERYHILKKLGEGGMGQVYLAEHVKMGRKSALKVMHPGMVKDVDAISRFNREAANASRISHPNVAAIYDFGETSDGVIYLAMEFVDGMPLTQVIEQTGALPAQRAAEIVRQAGEALAVAHDMGIVHRDLKPDNIMIAKTRDGDDLVKVVDFGIAKAAGSESQKVTKTGLVVGTPEYMSPEQLAGDKLDGRSDIYSLALVAFNMLTGKLPFPADSAQESMIMRLTDRPKTLLEMRPDVAWSPDVQAVMDRALERDAAMRYQTAAEFGRDLARVIDRMPETAAGPVGTQMTDLPPTRVAPPASSAPARTANAVPQTVAPSASPRAEAANQSARPRRKLLIPVLAGATAIAVGVAATLALTSRGSASHADSANIVSTQQSGMSVPGPATQVASAPDSQSAQTAAPNGAVAFNKPMDKPAATKSPAAAERTPSFDMLDSLANDSTTASRALRELAAKPLRSAEDSVRAALATFTAHLSLGSTDCSALDNVADIAPRTSKGSLLLRKRRDLCR